MKMTKLLTIIPAALSLSLAGAIADTACSPAIGFNKVTFKDGADSLLSVSFHQKPAFTGVLSSPSVTGSDLTLTASGASWTTDAFKDTHYVRFTSGVKNGFFYDVNSNGSDSLVLDGNGDDLSGVLSGDTFTLIPHWTLNSLFPDGSINESPSLFARATEILIPTVTPGINKGAQFSYFRTGGVWKDSNAANLFIDDSGDVIIRPNLVLVVRHNAGVGTVDTELCVSGRVPAGRNVVQIDASTTDNDVFLSLDRPIPVTLNESGLNDESIFVQSGSLFSREDILIVIDNGTAGFNKGANATYFRTGGVWKNSNAANLFTDDSGDVEVFQPGQAVILRKKGSGSGTTVFLGNEPTY